MLGPGGLGALALYRRRPRLSSLSHVEPAPAGIFTLPRTFPPLHHWLAGSRICHCRFGSLGPTGPARPAWPSDSRRQSRSSARHPREPTRPRPDQGLPRRLHRLARDPVRRGKKVVRGSAGPAERRRRPRSRSQSRSRTRSVKAVRGSAGHSWVPAAKVPPSESLSQDY